MGMALTKHDIFSWKKLHKTVYHLKIPGWFQKWAAAVSFRLSVQKHHKILLNLTPVH